MPATPSRDGPGPRRFELQIAGRVAKCGAALGIRALWKLCVDGLVYHSLEQANSIQSEVGKRQVSGPVVAPLDLTPEGATIN